jgi:hypothetical protein
LVSPGQLAPRGVAYGTETLIKPDTIAISARGTISQKPAGYTGLARPRGGWRKGGRGRIEEGRFGKK